MAIQENDLLLIKDNQTLYGKNLLNVYTYIATNVVPESLTYQRVALAFDLNIITEIVEAQVSSLVHTIVDVENLTNGIEFGSESNSRVGVNAVPANDLSTAISFTLKRGTKVTRNGGKRIGGIADDAFDANQMVSTYQTICTAIADAMQDTVPISVTGVGVVGVLRPVIIGRNPDGSFDLTRWQPVLDATYHLGASTQVSRKSLS